MQACQRRITYIPLLASSSAPCSCHQPSLAASPAAVPTPMRAVGAAVDQAVASPSPPSDVTLQALTLTRCRGRWPLPLLPLAMSLSVTKRIESACRSSSTIQSIAGLSLSRSRSGEWRYASEALFFSDSVIGIHLGHRLKLHWQFAIDSIHLIQLFVCFIELPAFHHTYFLQFILSSFDAGINRFHFSRILILCNSHLGFSLYILFPTHQSSHPSLCSLSPLRYTYHLCLTLPSLRISLIYPSLSLHSYPHLASPRLPSL